MSRAIQGWFSTASRSVIPVFRQRDRSHCGKEARLANRVRLLRFPEGLDIVCNSLPGSMIFTDTQGLDGFSAWHFPWMVYPNFSSSPILLVHGMTKRNDATKIVFTKPTSTWSSLLGNPYLHVQPQRIESLFGFLALGYCRMPMCMRDDPTTLDLMNQ